MNTLAIKNGAIVTPDGVKNQDIIIKNGIIAEIGNLNIADDIYIIDATNLHVLPGIIDPQVHFREPGLTHKEDIETGSMGAVAGGITTFFEMPNTSPATTTIDLLNQKYKIANSKSLANYSFFLGATYNNLDQILKLEDSCGLKIFMGSSTGDLLVDDDVILEKIFSSCNRIIAVHAEDEAILNMSSKYMVGRKFSLHMKARPVEAAVCATKKAINLALKHEKRLHVLHLSTADEVEMIRKIKYTGLVTAETTPQHLTLSGPDIYDKIGSYAQMNPPIRDIKHQEGLWEGLHDGTIDCIATDHAPHTIQEKSLEYGSAPSGMPGVETSLTIMLNHVNNGKARIEDIANWMSYNPAKIYKAIGKGKIAAGEDGDLTIVDLKRSHKIQNKNTYTKCGWSAFDGMVTQGWPIKTIVNGNIVFNRDSEIKFNNTIKGEKVRFSI